MNRLDFNHPRRNWAPRPDVPWRLGCGGTTSGVRGVSRGPVWRGTQTVAGGGVATGRPERRALGLACASTQGRARGRHASANPPCITHKPRPSAHAGGLPPRPLIRAPVGVGSTGEGGNASHVRAVPMGTVTADRPVGSRRVVQAGGWDGATTHPAPVIGESRSHRRKTSPGPVRPRGPLSRLQRGLKAAREQRGGILRTLET